jgi:TonB family protein
MSMFEQMQWPGRKRWSRSLIASVAAHLAVLVVLIYPSTPTFVTPSDLQLGIPHSSGSLSIVYLAPVGPEQAEVAPEQPKLALRASLPPRPKPHKIEAKREQPDKTIADNALDQTARGGSLFGHTPGSPLVGNEVVPAFPDVYPDPSITKDELPSGVQGDVIVEVTIDPRGNVIETKQIQGMGYGIEQKVLDVLQRWNFHPAMRDGVTISSQHIVHFHYHS